jgi:hypothetical protein
LNGLSLRARDRVPREELHEAIDGAMAAWKTLTTPKPAARVVKKRRARSR